ncbi:MAG: hypothetical protein SNF33_04455 [Candidatus Algichlamydia australiensis]|nr:hypothetical protein [Chlamydiales bacterium]
MINKVSQYSESSSPTPPPNLEKKELDTRTSNVAKSHLSLSKKDPLSFLKESQTYYEKIEEGVDSFLGQLRNPTEKEVSALVDEILFRNTSIKLGIYSSELISSIREIAKTKTGYFVINRAIERNSRIILEMSESAPCCKEANSLIVDLLQVNFLILLAPLLFLPWRYLHPESPKEKYFNALPSSYKILLTSKSHERVSLNQDGNIRTAQTSLKEILLHELTHTYDKYKIPTAFKDVPRFDQFDNVEEMHALMIESAYAKESGSKLRSIAHWGFNRWKRDISTQLSQELNDAKNNSVEAETLLKLIPKAGLHTIEGLKA